MADKEQLDSQEFANVRSSTEQDRWILLWQAAIEEFKSLRSEVVVIQDRQYSMLYWAISSMALLLAAILNSWDRLQLQYPDLLVSVFFFLIPIVATTFLWGWSHLVIQLARLGTYIYGIETKLSHILEKYPPPPYGAPETVMNMPLGWEHSLWQQDGQEFINRTCGIVKFAVAFFYLLSFSFGIFLFLGRLRSNFAWLSMDHAVEIAIGVFTFWTAVWFVVFQVIAHQLTKAVALRNDYD